MKGALRLLAAISLLAAQAFCHAQDSDASDASAQSSPAPQASPRPTPAAQPSPSPNPNETLENTFEAGDSPDEPRRKLVKWNEYAGPYFTIRAGGGLLLEAVGYSQDQESKEQFRLKPDFGLRDFRFLLNGKFPQFERSVTWSAGIMYDGPTHSWLVRQTGVVIAFPELWGHLWVGRTKSGFSLEKVMHGYDGWWMERSAMNDATVQLLADGFKWLGATPKRLFLWNLGYYNDVFSHTQSFSSYHTQYVARPIWLPIHSEEGSLLHLGANLFYGIPENHQLQLKSRPEAFPAPFFVDTGKFPAAWTRMEGYEAYYRRGSLLFGSEYWWENIHSPSTGNPTVHGGFVLATWLLTGETRPYNLVGGLFKDISPKRTVFEGGPGAWELVLRYSTVDLNSKGINGGNFKRFTPMMNWYLSDNIRLELGYGYGHLDRFNLKGNTHFFQTRIQFQL
jgi:phosphate-selective porin OprO/OprP